MCKIKAVAFLEAGELEKKVYKTLREEGLDISLSAVQVYSNFYDLISRFSWYKKEEIEKIGYMDFKTNISSPIPSLLRKFLIELIEKNGENAIWKYFAQDIKHKKLAGYITKWVKIRLNPANYAFDGALVILSSKSPKEIEFEY